MILLEILRGAWETIRETLPGDEREGAVFLSAMCWSFGLFFLTVFLVSWLSCRTSWELLMPAPFDSAALRSGQAVAERMARPEAIAIAKAFVAEIEDATEQLIVGGSLRRRLAMIGDVEIVAVPKVEHVVGGLFGDVGTDIDRLDARMTALLDNDEVSKRLDRNGSPRWGPTLKYVTFQGARVDLFSPCAERFGWILLLRTGPEAFSRQLVRHRGLTTRDGRPGLLPALIKPREGFLTWGVSGQKIETRDEREVFRLFGLSYQEPWERS